MKLCGACILTSNVPRLVNFYKEIFCIEPFGDDTHSAFDDMQFTFLIV